jgi:hypothetical protein
MLCCLPLAFAWESFLQKSRLLLKKNGIQAQWIYAILERHIGYARRHFSFLNL